MGTILVTGAGGFVGGNVADYLIRNGYQVCGTYHNTEPDISNGMKKIKVDLSNKADLEEKILSANIGQIDAVLHFAAQMVGPNIADYLENTVQSTRNLLAYASENNVRTFIYASSIAVYGMTESEVNEKSDRTNLTDYGIAKYICERLLEDAAIKNRITIRLPRMLGGRIDLSCPWLPKLTGDLLEHKEIKYFNPNMKYNNLAHCDALAEFIDALINRKEDGYSLVGIGSSEPEEILEIVKYLKKLTKSQSSLIEKKAEQRNTCSLIDISKAVSMGYQPMTVKATLEHFIRDLMNV